MTCPLGLPLVDENTESIAFFQSRGTWLALYPRESLAADAGVAAATATSSRASTSSRVRTLWARVTPEKPLPSVASVPIKLHRAGQVSNAQSDNADARFHS